MSSSGAEGQTLAAPTTTIQLGGSVNQGVAAYALLDGIHQDETAVVDGDNSNNNNSPNNNSPAVVVERVTIPITCLPAVIGRSHDSTDDEPNFFGLGSNKAISRRQCTIYYRDADGGRVEWDPKATVVKDDNGDEVACGRLVYVPPDKIRRQVGDDAMEADKLNHNNNNNAATTTTSSNDNDNDNDGHLPPRGFFVLECLGKNRIVVDNQRVHQGHSIVLRNGSAIRISSYCLYFFLPTDATTTSITVPSMASSSGDPTSSKKHKKKKKMKDKKRLAVSSTPDSPSKRIKASSSFLVAGDDSVGDGSASGNMATNNTNYQKELDALSCEELLSLFEDAMKNGTWDRRTQLLGSSICMRAVVDAGRGQIALAKKEGDSLSRKEIIDWIARSERYSNWVLSMHEKMESRSYVSSITRCLLRAGFVRNAGSGRYIRWILPDNVLSMTEDDDTGDMVTDHQPSNSKRELDSIPSTSPGGDKNTDADDQEEEGDGDDQEEEEKEEGENEEKQEEDDNDDEEEKQEEDDDEEKGNDDDGDHDGSDADEGEGNQEDEPMDDSDDDGSTSNIVQSNSPASHPLDAGEDPADDESNDQMEEEEEEEEEAESDEGE